MEKYFVSGAMGFVGSHLCEYLLKKGKTVYGLDLGVWYPKLLEYENFIYVQDTIKDYSVLQTIINKVDCVCHLAGIAEPAQYTNFPRKVIDITAVVGLRVIDMCRFSGKLFFFTSTSEIYGKSTDIPFKEDGPRVLGNTSTKRWCYSTSKAIIEHYLDACAFTKEIDYVSVRLFNVYGPRLKGRVVSNFMESALAGKDILVHGDGHQTRSFSYIDDVIEAFDLLIHDPKCHNNVFNVGNPDETSVIQLADTIKEIAESPSEIRFIEHNAYYGDSYEDIDRRVPDISRIQKFAGWKPHTTLEDGIKKTFKYLQDERIKWPEGRG